MTSRRRSEIEALRESGRQSRRDGKPISSHHLRDHWYETRFFEEGWREVDSELAIQEEHREQENMHGMTTCRDCRYWQADPSDNGVGACTGLVASGRIEISVGADAADTVEIYMPHDHYCKIGQEDNS